MWSGLFQGGEFQLQADTDDYWLGTYWSSTALANTSAYHLGMDNEDWVEPAIPNAKGYGYAVRCVAP
jgi:hypothetical protein